MAVTTINLTDPVTTLVTKTNTISGDVGDVATLVTGDDNVVDAINTVRDIVARFDDSNEIIALAREGVGISSPLNIQDTTTGTLSLSYDSASGTLSFAGSIDSNEIKTYFSSGQGLDYDSSTGVFGVTSLGITNAMLTNSTITSSKFSSKVTLQILDSTGSAVKTLYSPGS